MTTQDRVIPIRSPEQEEIERLRAHNDALRNAYMEAGEREHNLRTELAALRKQYSELYDAFQIEGG